MLVQNYYINHVEGMGGPPSLPDFIAEFEKQTKVNMDVDKIEAMLLYEKDRKNGCNFDE